MQRSELGEEVREGIGLVKVRIGGTVVEEGDGEVEVGERNGCEGFDKDIDYDIRVVEILVELIKFQDGKVGEAIIFLASNLVIQIILQNPNIGRVIPINA